MKLLEKIKEYALTQPEAEAFISPHKIITYRDLWELSDRLAGSILELNLQIGNPILVYGHMEPEMVVAFLGIVKAGHPYIPVDTSIPLDRVQKIIESSQAELLLNISDQLLTFDETSVQIKSFMEVVDLNCNVSEIDSVNWVKSDENYYIIYTSGSTGNPKGVQISADNLQSFVNWMITDFPVNGRLRFLNQAPFSFDLSVMDLYPALASGGSIFAITKELIAKPKLLFEALKKSKTQVWTSTPSFVQMCLMDPSFNEYLLPELSVFLFCGEILPGAIANQLLDRFPNAKVFNTYGPTEATVAVTYVEITKKLINSFPHLPVGMPKNDCTILIVDEDGREAAEGEKGEIVIVGPSVSKGYLGQLDLTNKSFLKIDEKMAYKTGDAGFVDQGLLFCNGRMDFQIKLHGYRMELEEIEHHLVKSQFVKMAVVVPVYQNDKIEYLSAAVVPGKHGFEKEYQLTSAIKKEIGNLLPSYMIPRKFTYHDDLPITANGKIDRKQIKEKVLV